MTVVARLQSGFAPPYLKGQNNTDVGPEGGSTLFFSSPVFSSLFSDEPPGSTPWPEAEVLFRGGVSAGGREATRLGLRAASWSISSDGKSSWSLGSGKLLEGLSSVGDSSL